MEKVGFAVPIPSTAAGPSARCARRISQTLANLVATISDYRSLVVCLEGKDIKRDEGWVSICCEPESICDVVVDYIYCQVDLNYYFSKRGFKLLKKYRPSQLLPSYFGWSWILITIFIGSTLLGCARASNIYMQCSSTPAADMSIATSKNLSIVYYYSSKFLKKIRAAVNICLIVSICWRIW